MLKPATAAENPYRGVFASTPCPLATDGTIDREGLTRMLGHLADQPGINGFLINGHAGENIAMPLHDQVEVARIAMEAVGARSRIMVGVNAESTSLAAALAAELEALGVDSLLVFAPSSWAAASDTEMALTHHRAIVEATRLPILLFQAAVHAGHMAYSPETLAALVQLPRVMGIKEGSWEVAAYEANLRFVRDRAPDVTVLGSGDEHLFTSACVGSDGAIVSLASVTPEPIVQLLAAVDAGDLAEARFWHDRIYPIARAIYADPPHGRTNARLKACLKLQGLIDHDGVLPPAVGVTATERVRLAEALENASVRERSVSKSAVG